MSDPLSDAVIREILAREAQAQGSVAAPKPNASAAQPVRDQYALMEEQLTGYTRSLAVHEQGLPRSVRYCPTRGLGLADNPAGAWLSWREVPEQILVHHAVLLLALEKQWKAQVAAHGARLVQATAAAEVEAAARIATPAPKEYITKPPPGAFQSVLPAGKAEETGVASLVNEVLDNAVEQAGALKESV